MDEHILGSEISFDDRFNRPADKKSPAHLKTWLNERVTSGSQITQVNEHVSKLEDGESIIYWSEKYSILEELDGIVTAAVFQKNGNDLVVLAARDYADYDGEYLLDLYEAAMIDGYDVIHVPHMKMFGGYLTTIMKTCCYSWVYDVVFYDQSGTNTISDNIVELFDQACNKKETMKYKLIRKSMDEN